MAEIKLRNQEVIKETVRAHPIKIAVPIIFASLLIGLDFFMLFPLFRLGYFGVAIFGLMLVFAALVAVWSYVRWRSTLFIITNQRVIDVDRVGLFRWEVSDINYNNIADISYKIVGALETILKAGDVVVTTQSGSHTIQAIFVPDPGGVRETIMAEIMSSKIWSVPGHDGREKVKGPASGEDERAIERYAEWRKKRRAMVDYLGDSFREKSDEVE
jgi:membrane protein YdbS with pleckstrin-like domain